MDSHPSNPRGRAALGIALTVVPFALVLWSTVKRKAPSQFSDMRAQTYDQHHDAASGPEEERANRRGERRRDWIRLLIEAFGLLAVAVAAYVGLKNLASLNQQVVISNRQAAIAARQLDLTDRPWIKASIELGGPFRQQQDSVNLPLVLTLENIGRSVASGIFVEFSIIPNPWGEELFTLPLEEQRQLCERAISRNARSRTLALFPNESNQGTMSGGIYRRQMEAVAKTFPPELGYAPVMPVVVGCVDYQFGASREHHQTMFLYTVDRQTSGPPGPFDVAHMHETPLAAMRLQKWFFGGNDAN